MMLSIHIGSYDTNRVVEWEEGTSLEAFVTNTARDILKEFSDAQSMGTQILFWEVARPSNLIAVTGVHRYDNVRVM